MVHSIIKFRLSVSGVGIYSLLPILFFIFSQTAKSQEIYKSVKGEASFFSDGPVEDIEAKNKKCTSFLNLSTGDILVSMQQKDFTFHNALMQEHFNENYMESEKYPKAEFKGKLSQYEEVLKLADGTTLKCTATGILSMHGVSKEKTMQVEIKKIGGQLIATSTFPVSLEEYKIDRPKLVWQSLAEVITTTVTFTYEKYQK